MRASIENMRRALGSPKAPRELSQASFDYDSSHLHRLVNLQGNEPAVGDLIDYILDIHYRVIQPDLLRYLLPDCFNAWHRYQFDKEKSKYGAFVEQFSSTLQERPFLEEILSSKEYEAVVTFWSDSILDLQDQENSLHIAGMSPTHRWFHALGTFATSVPELEKLWQEWWQMKTEGHAICVLQFLSCILYDVNENPVFEVWNRKTGGGSPLLWETQGFTSSRGWKEKNITFLQSSLTLDYIESALHKAHDVLQNVTDSTVPKQMIDDLVLDKELVELRLEYLPELLREPEIGT